MTRHSTFDRQGRFCPDRDPLATIRAGRLYLSPRTLEHIQGRHRTRPLRSCPLCDLSHPHPILEATR